MSGGHVWRAAQDHLRHDMTRAQFDTWLRGTHLTEAGEDGVAVLRVRTTFARELLETRFRERIEAAIAQVTGQACKVRVVVGGPVADDADDAEDAQDAPAGARVRNMTQPVAASEHHRSAKSGPRAIAAAYSGQELFGAPVAVSADASAAEPSRPREVTGGARRRAISGPNRAAPRAERLRAAVERATAATGPLGARAGAREAAATMAAEMSTARVVSSPGEAQAGDDGDARSSGRRGEARRREESDGYTMMSESSDPRGNGGPVPAPRLNPRYTFNMFIVGSGNQLAHAASQAVAEAPGQAYNPLFLYGGVGLGKTHLLHAIGHKALAMDLSVLYVSSETFTNEIINAIRYRTTEEFRAKYRSVDVLLVDDIQFIAGKESTEEEFFHTFNSLHEMSKQIVICSDRPPKAIVSLEERLRSRFEWGLIADIQPPDLETRMAILRAKADVVGRSVPDEVIAYLAGQVQSNIRELEGSFNRLLAFSQLQNLPLTVETAKAALANITSDGRQRRVTVAEVLAAVAGYYRISEDDLRGKQRDKHIVVPRQVAMYLMRQETEASLLEIGQALGGRDHSTVLHGCEKIGRGINESTSLRKEVLAIRQQLLG
ncbi:MAG TPA: chromosomal replication initiator protein DnaA [Ktedonobacterales bacterium]